MHTVCDKMKLYDQIALWLEPYCTNIESYDNELVFTFSEQKMRIVAKPLRHCIIICSNIFNKVSGSF